MLLQYTVSAIVILFLTVGLMHMLQEVWTVVRQLLQLT